MFHMFSSNFNSIIVDYFAIIKINFTRLSFEDIINLFKINFDKKDYNFNKFVQDIVKIIINLLIINFEFTNYIIIFSIFFNLIIDFQFLKYLVNLTIHSFLRLLWV